VVDLRHYSRPDIINKLLIHRNLIRVLSAPVGFGKSTIAYEYASMMFAFKKVFWVSCVSPCFIRDLDNGVIFNEAIKCFPEPKMIIFEDLPPLEENRLTVFLSEVDRFMELGCEVLITCEPHCQSVSKLRQNCIVFNWNDLLLSDSELSIDVLSGRISEKQFQNLSMIDRIAGWVWSGAVDAKCKTVASVIDADVSPAQKAAIFLICLLQEGFIEDLICYIPRGELCVCFGLLEKDYGIFGINMSDETFECTFMDLPLLKRTFQPCLSEISKACSFDDTGEFIDSLASMLSNNNDFDRCVSLLKEFANSSVTANWLSNNGWHLVRQARPFDLLTLLDHARRNFAQNFSALCRLELMANYQLSNFEELTKCIRKILKSAKADNCSKKLALAFACVYLNPSEARNLIGSLSFVLNAPETKIIEGVTGLPDVQMEHASDCLLDVASLMLESSILAFESWGKNFIQLEHNLEIGILENSVNQITAYEALLLAASWLFSYAYDDETASSNLVVSSVSQLTTMLAKIESEETLLYSNSSSWFEACVLDSITSPDICSEQYLEQIGLVSALQNMHAVFSQLDNQRLAYTQQLASMTRSRAQFNSTHPDIFRRENMNSKFNSIRISDVGVPVLRVNIFGGLEVFIDGELVDGKAFKREKLRIALALLLLNKGSEISRDTLAECLWPESTIETRRRNFYSVWEQLKKSLNVDSYCPYLIKSKLGCSLDLRHVESDVFEFKNVYKTLMFEMPSNAWQSYYLEIHDKYGQPILPGDCSCDALNRFRNRSHTMLVDALTCASEQLCEQGELRGALMFAREALLHDSRREDCYITLMRAQLSLGQQAHALDTFFECKTFLNEELGIDPSKKMTKLYREIIET
jgi:DNA-binding SARP family transcriptional activator